MGRSATLTCNIQPNFSHYVFSQGAFNVIFNLPNSMQVAGDTVLVNGNKVGYQVVNGKVIVRIDIGKNTGSYKLVFAFNSLQTGNHDISAQIANADMYEYADIGRVYLETTAISIDAPKVTYTHEQILVSGKAEPDSIINVYEGKTVLAITTANKAGNWFTYVDLVGAYNGSVTYHELYAIVINADNISVKTLTAKVKHDPSFPEISKITIANNSYNEIDFHEQKNIYYYNYAQPDFAFKVTFLNKMPSSATLVIKTSNGGVDRIPLKNHGSYFYCNASYFEYELPNWIGVDYELDGEAISGIGKNIIAIIDPSGYVYELVEENRLEGVTASLYYKANEDDTPEFWAAADFGQINPLLTDKDGRYAWDVPSGLWQVKYEKEGYLTVYSDWLPVPPPQTEVNIAMVSTVSPTVKNIVVTCNYIDIEFSHYMGLDGIMKALSNISNFAIEFNPIMANNVQYIKAVRLNGEFATVFVEFIGAFAYNGLELYYAQELTATDIPTYLELRSAMSTDQSSLEVQIYVSEKMVGKTVVATAKNGALLSVENTQAIIDEFGVAKFMLNFNMPCISIVEFSMGEFNLKQEFSFEYQPIIIQVVNMPTVNISGLVATNTQIYFSSSAPNIFYTTDPNLTVADIAQWQLYDYNSIISIDQDITYYVVSEDGGVFSEIATFTYKVLHQVTYTLYDGSVAFEGVASDGYVTKANAFETIAGYTFNGWYIDNSSLFDVNNPVISSLNLFGRWTLSAPTASISNVDGTLTALVSHDLELSCTYSWYKDGAFLKETLENALDVSNFLDNGEYYCIVNYTDGSTGGSMQTDNIQVSNVKKVHDLSGIAFEDRTVTFNGEHFNILINGTLPIGVKAMYYVDGKEFSGTASAGEYLITVKFENGDLNYEDIALTISAMLTINKANFDLSGITFAGSEVTYDGANKTIAISGVLPSGVTVKYYVNDIEFSGAINAGTYNLVAKFTHEKANYNQIADLNATLTINKANFDLSGITFAGSEVTYDGASKTIAIGGALPNGVTVKYYVNDVEFNGALNAGTYNIVAKFMHENANYNPITATLSALLTINKANFDLSGITFAGSEVTYDGASKTIAIGGALPNSVTVKYYVNDVEFSGAINAGTYNIVVKFTHENANYNQIADLNATLTINKANFDLSGITFTGSEVTYDGASKTIAIGGALPNGVTVKYYVNDVEFNGAINAGTYNVVAKFTHENANYNPITATLSATLTINKANFNLSGLTFAGSEVTYDGASKTIAISGVLPSGVTVKYYVNDVEFNGAINAGTYNVVAKFTHENANYNPITATLSATLTILQETTVSKNSCSGSTANSLIPILIILISLCASFKILRKQKNI